MWVWHGLLGEVEVRCVGGAREDVAQTHTFFLAAVMRLHKEKPRQKSVTLKCLSLTIVSYLWLMPDLNTKGAKFTCSTQAFFSFKKSSSGELGQ